MEIEWPERLRRWLDFEVDTDKWMRVEEIREDGFVVVRAELPGLNPDTEIDVWVADGMLHIAAKREMREERQDKGMHRSEFHYGEFSRTLPMPNGIDHSAVKAMYKDGILEVRIPWMVESKEETTKVPIERG
jgi:HSP20 family protein